jgi:curved DNA-binding protein CbpA
VSDDPFAALGLPPRADLTDDDVRAAWRRIAAATHPDRDDGGDPATFGAAGAAYALLRTAWDRGEVLAELGLLGSAAAPRRRPRYAAARSPPRAGRQPRSG